MKRRWFQIHLSTALIVMFVASLIIWANTRIFRGGSLLTDGNLVPNQYVVDLNTLFGRGQYIEARGWPFRYQYTLKDNLEFLNLWWSLPMDLVVMVTVLLLTVVVTEHLIRRRDRGRT
jgi:hypothetical protein